MELNFDVKGKVEEIVKKLQGSPELTKGFQKDPVKTIEKILGVDLPDDKLQPLVAGVKAKLTASDLGGRLDGLKKLF